MFHFLHRQSLDLLHQKKKNSHFKFLDLDLAKFHIGIWNLPETSKSHPKWRFRPTQTRIWSNIEHRVYCTDQGTRIENFGSSGQKRIRLISSSFFFFLASVWIPMKMKIISLFSFFFGTIHRPHYTISANFYLYL